MASRSLMPFSRNMPMSRWGEETDPFLAMRREMNRLFDDFSRGFGLASFGQERFVCSGLIGWISGRRRG